MIGALATQCMCHIITPHPCTRGKVIGRVVVVVDVVIVVIVNVVVHKKSPDLGI